MLRFLAALSAAFLVMVGQAAPAGAQAPAWNDARARALVERATERRIQQLTDTALVDYKSTAHGYVAFLAQLGEGLTEPPKIVKADELELEVYWKAPNLSKQHIVGRRDTLLLPTDIAYHRDHLGIVQNNFPSIIRLGEGDEVRDVPHPLSSAGLQEYDFAVGDSLSLQLPDRTIFVYEVRVRPRDDRQPRVIGAVYIDRETAQVVRMAFNFTRAAFIDKELEDLSVVLENALVNGRFWLPRRQEIEIRRAGTWLDYPARGIIRGRWDVCCYEVNTGIPSSFFGGQEIVFARPASGKPVVFRGRILDSLPPDVRAVTDEDVKRVQDEARTLVRAQALARTSGAALSARRISDFARVNRVEGLALGAGSVFRFGSGVSAQASGRWGVDDRAAKGRVALDFAWPSGAGVQVFAERAYRDVGDVQETSLVLSSLAAQEYGSDRTDLYDARAAGVTLALGTHYGTRSRVTGAYETQDRLAVHATPALGRYEQTIPAMPLRSVRLALDVERPTSLAAFGTELRWTGQLRVSRFEDQTRSGASAAQLLRRAFVGATVERPFGDQRLVLRTTVGAVGGARDVPAQDYVYLGGPTSGPGYDFHQFAARVGVSQHVEWRTPVPFPSFPLGRYGRSPATATLAPFAHVIYVDGAAPFTARRGGWYPSLGVGSSVFFDLLRLDVARGLRDGRWTFSIDVTRDFWRIL